MKKFIIIILIFLLILLGVLFYFYIDLSKQKQVEEASIIVEPQTIKDYIEKSNSKYISEKNNTIYVEFNKDLFEENGEDNKDYFYGIIDDLKQFFPMKSFYLVDEEKDIEIRVEYSLSTNGYIIKINNVENFYDTISGKKYTDVDKMTITKNSSIYIENPYLNKLLLGTMYFDSIEEELGEGTPLEDGYISYLDGKIKIRLAPTKAVRNIIFSKDYDEQVVEGITPDMSLRQIKNVKGDNSFGSLDEKYLGYKEEDYYVFFYEDEISIYTYAYKYEKDMKEIIEEYLQTKDLGRFVTRLSKRCPTYDKIEYNEETQDAYMLYSNRGLEVNIKNNDSTGIKLYTNFYLTDDMRQYVKDGLIDIDSKTDLLDKTERERRNNKQ